MKFAKSHLNYVKIVYRLQLREFISTLAMTISFPQGNNFQFIKFPNPHDRRSEHTKTAYLTKVMKFTLKPL